MTILLNTLPLSYDLTWVDEFAWSKTKFSPKFTLGKRLLINYTQVKGNTGRPMTLQAPYAWMTRKDIQDVQDLLDTNTEPLQITLHDGRQFNVIPVGEGFKATSLQDNPEPVNDTWYSVSFTFIITN